jgi:hypothetical protein
MDGSCGQMALMGLCENDDAFYDMMGEEGAMMQQMGVTFETLCCDTCSKPAECVDSPNMGGACGQMAAMGLCDDNDAFLALMGEDAPMGLTFDSMCCETCSGDGDGVCVDMPDAGCNGMVPGMGGEAACRNPDVFFAAYASMAGQDAADQMEALGMTLGTMCCDTCGKTGGDSEHDDQDKECADDEDKVAEDSQGALSCAIAIGVMGGSCDDDSALVAMGAPAGWIGSLCLESCGYCGGDDQDKECADDEDQVAEDSQGQLSCAMAIGMMGGSCDDDSALVAMGAPAGWIGSACHDPRPAPPRPLPNSLFVLASLASQRLVPEVLRLLRRQRRRQRRRLQHLRGLDGERRVRLLSRDGARRVRWR